MENRPIAQVFAWPIAVRDFTAVCLTIGDLSLRKFKISVIINLNLKKNRKPTVFRSKF